MLKTGLHTYVGIGVPRIAIVASRRLLILDKNGAPALTHKMFLRLCQERVCVCVCVCTSSRPTGRADANPKFPRDEGAWDDVVRYGLELVNAPEGERGRERDRELGECSPPLAPVRNTDAGHFSSNTRARSSA